MLYIIINVPLLQALEHYYTIIAYFGKPNFMETLPICLVSWLKFKLQLLFIVRLFNYVVQMFKENVKTNGAF